ncbi:MAG: DUF4397 domain-containing protein [Aeromicrobium sp.]
MTSTTSATITSRTRPAGLVLALLTALVAAPFTGLTAASSADATSQVFIVQGVPGIEVAVTVDGRAVESAVKSKTVIGPVNLPSGQHTVAFASDGWTVEKSFDADGPSIDVVLHWPADPAQQPETTVFSNDISPVAAGKGRLTVAHTAVVPPADVRVDGKVVFANIANGEFVTADVPADTYPVDIVPTGGSAPLLGPVELPVKAGALTRVFAIGQPTGGSMDAVVQVVSSSQGGSVAPTSVDAGSAGLVAPGHSAGGRGPQPVAVATGVLAIVLIGAVAIALVNDRLRRARG